MQNLNKTTITQLNALAEKYETHSFINEDPSQFLYKFQNQADTEILSFIAAMLSFGKRDQFIKKINYIVEKSESSPHQWIKNKHYLKNFIESAMDFKLCIVSNFIFSSTSFSFNFL